MKKTTSALDAFLKSDVDITKIVNVQRLNTQFTIKALSGDALKSATSEATDSRGNIDNTALYAAIIAESVEEDLFNNAELMLAKGANSPTECVSKVLLLGEIMTIGKDVMEISGFDVDAQIEKAKN